MSFFNFFDDSDSTLVKGPNDNAEAIVSKKDDGSVNVPFSDSLDAYSTFFSPEFRGETVVESKANDIFSNVPFSTISIFSESRVVLEFIKCDHHFEVLNMLMCTKCI